MDRIASMLPSANFRMIRLGREMREMSQTKLANESGVPQANVSRIESDMRPATDDELGRIADALQLPVAFFMEPDTPSAAPMFRKRAIRSVTANRKIQARINTAVLAARRIIDAGVDIDTPFTFPAPGEISGDDPTEAAAAIRRAWRLPHGRIDNVTAIIEGAGGIVLHVDFGSDAASAAFVSSFGDERLWFLVNTHETAGDRIRLSLAHELGHAVMHRYLPIHDEARHEPDAYQFGIALLLDPSVFDRSVGPNLDLRRARDLKRANWVSIQAIVKAARDRNLISSSRYTSLYKQISARGWRRDEPDAIPIEQPTIWPAVLEVHRTRHGYTDEDLAQIARLTPDDLASLFPRNFAPRLSIVGGNGPRPTIGPARSRRSA